MNHERELAIDADEIGVQVLAFVASHQDLIDRFVEVTGFDPGDLRRLATEPSFFVAVLDFFLAHEPDLIDLAFAAARAAADDRPGAERTGGRRGSRASNFRMLPGRLRAASCDHGDVIGETI